MNVYRVITRVIEVILHGYEYKCALRFWLALWCALGTKSLKKTALDYAVHEHLHAMVFPSTMELFSFVSFRLSNRIRMTFRLQEQ